MWCYWSTFNKFSANIDDNEQSNELSSWDSEILPSVKLKQYRKFSLEKSSGSASKKRKGETVVANPRKGMKGSPRKKGKSHQVAVHEIDLTSTKEFLRRSHE